MIKKVIRSVCIQYTLLFFLTKLRKLLKKKEKIINTLKKGFAGKSFENIANYLLTSSGIADRYMCLADFEDYMKVHQKMDEAYLNKKHFNQMSLVNISEAGRFAADRSIKEYADKIWYLKPVK